MSECKKGLSLQEFIAALASDMSLEELEDVYKACVAQTVVFCKDCKHFRRPAFAHKKDGYCELTYKDVDDLDFCSQGEGGQNA